MAEISEQDRSLSATISTLIIVAFVAFGVWAYTGGISRHPEIFDVAVPHVRVETPSPALPPSARSDAGPSHPTS
jgi:hypothetical protein